MLIFDVLWKKLKGLIEVIKMIMIHTLKYIKNIYLAVLLKKLFVLMINLANQLFSTKEKMQSINLLKQLLKNISITKKWWKKQFNKTLITSEKDEQMFQSSNKCCQVVLSIFQSSNKLFDVEDNKLRDHCHITGKYRGKI